MVGELRRGVADFARAHGADDDVIDNIALAVSEAVTNAIIHAFVGRQAGRVALTAEAGEGSILVRVLDDGRGMTPHPESPGLGLGLTMMASMATRCDIREGAGGVGTEVRLAFDAPGVSGPALSLGEGDERLELLVAVERLADGAGWPDEGVDALVALLVPRVADACTLDVVDEAGEPRRLAAHYEGPAGPEGAALLASRRPTREQIDITVAALREGRSRLISDVTPETLRALAHDDAEAEQLAAMELAHWINVPLLVSDQLLGALGLGLSAVRPSPEEQLPFFEALAERAARGLANTRLITELRGRAGGSSGSSTRWPRRSPSTTPAASSSTPTARRRRCSARHRSTSCWPPSRASSPRASSSPARTARRCARRTSRASGCWPARRRRSC